MASRLASAWRRSYASLKAGAAGHTAWFAYRCLIYLFLIGLAFVYLYPFLYMISTSLKTQTDLADPTVNWIPREWNVQSFLDAYRALHYLEYAWNSAKTTVLAVIGQVASCAFAAYGFARFRFPGRELLFGVAMLTLVVPPQTIIVPLYMQFKQLGWIDTILPLVVPEYFAQGLRGALFLFIFRQFFRGLPTELEDAARVDGCTSFGTYARIILPIAYPALFVSAILSAVWHWNNYFEPSVYLVDRSNFTLPMMIDYIGQSMNAMKGGAGSFIVDRPTMMAACLLVILPLLIVYFEVQRYFMKSIERTGIVG